MRERLADLAFLPIFVVTNLIVLPIAVVLDLRDQLRGR